MNFIHSTTPYSKSTYGMCIFVNTNVCVPVCAYIILILYFFVFNVAREKVCSFKCIQVFVQQQFWVQQKRIYSVAVLWDQQQQPLAVAIIYKHSIWTHKVWTFALRYLS